MKVKLSLRKFLLFACFFFSALVAAQIEVAFDNSGFNAVLQQSKAKHKPVFYMLFADWCSHCKKMKAEVFKDPEVAQFINSNFVSGWQDIEKGEGEFFRKTYNIRAFPTFMFFDETGKLLYIFNGEYTATNFITEVKNALVREKQLPYLEQQFKESPTNSFKCLEYLIALKKGFERDRLNPFAQQYLATQTDAQLASEANWRIIANGVSDLESHPFQYVLQHQDQFAAVSSPKRVQKKIVNIVMEWLQPFTETTDTVNYKKKRYAVEAIGLQKTDSLLFRYDLQVAAKAKNWKWYAKTTQYGAEKYIWTDAAALREIGQNYEQHITDPIALRLGLKAMEQSLALNDSYDADLIAARLYRKINDYQSAILLAEKARKRNADLGFNTKDADELLQQLNTR